MLKRLLLGPQRPVRNLGVAIERAGMPAGPMAVISAGWQEAEGDIDDVRELVQQPLIDLNLYSRAEALFATDAALRSAYRERQDRLKELQSLYQMRLRQLTLAARRTLRADGSADLVATELRHAIAQLRSLDRHHLKRVHAINGEFDERFALEQYAPLAEQHAAVAEQLRGCESVIITGGNVVVLLNRLRMFGTHLQLRDKHLVAWSAGCMVLSDRVVLFHDLLPQGRRDPELLGPGTGLIPGYVFLPDARRRLRTTDKVRTGLYSRRFHPAECVTLDSGAQLLFAEGKLLHSELARRMTVDGGLQRMRAV